LQVLVVDSGPKVVGDFLTAAIT
ncbi:hypothetical protein LCGC14_2081360, partial [marine sediment metagenome]